MKVFFLIIFLIPIVSSGQNPSSDKYFFEKHIYSNSRVYNSPRLKPEKKWFTANTEVEFNVTTLHEATYDEPMNQPNQKIRWILDDEDNMSWIYNSSNAMRGGRFYGLVKRWGKAPTSYFFYDNNVFRDNAMAVILESANLSSRTETAVSINFKKSDLEPLAFRLNFVNSGIKNNFNVVFIFDDDMNTKIETEFSSLEEDFDLMKHYSRERQISVSNWKPISPKDKLISSLKKYSKVDIMINDGSKRIYSTIPLSGSTSALNKILGIVEPTRKNSFEFAYSFGLANYNPFDWEGFILKFLDDAKNNHGINLDYIKNRNIITISKRLEGRTIALAAGMNNDNEVIIAIDPDSWYKASPAKRWYIMYHELGHDILNFEHGEGGPMMNPETSGSYTWSRFEKDKSIMLNHYKKIIDK